MQVNILATSASPQTSARNLDNRNIEGQILTMAVLLSAYGRKTCYPYDNLWKHVSLTHPFLRWMLNTEANIDWAKDYAVMLLIEYGQRTGRQHKGSKSIYTFIEDFGTPVGLEPIAFMNRAWDDTFDFRYEKCTNDAYRKLLCAKWNFEDKKLSWGDRMPPTWYVEYQIACSGVPENWDDTLYMEK